MLQRFYLDNYRTLVNFEWKPKKFNLLLGENGSGKSSVVDALWAVRALVVERDPVALWFPASSRTRWDQRAEQRFELEVRLSEDTYTYELVVEHHPDDFQKSRVKSEVLRVGGQILMKMATQDRQCTLYLYKDSGDPGPEVSSDWTRSGLGFVFPHPSNARLTRFKEWLAKDIWLFRPNPQLMTSHAERVDQTLLPNLENFAAWWPAATAADFEGNVATVNHLRGVLYRFQSLQVGPSGSRLEAKFRGDKGPYVLDFMSLSEGQRLLCALYHIVGLVVKEGRLIIFDEPDNYLGLREIQPWFLALQDVASALSSSQIWLISHHPEVLNLSAPNYGTKFFREDGPTRTKPFEGIEELTPAEVVARGWNP